MGNQALHLPAIERDGEAAKAVEGDRAFLVAGILTAKFAGSAGTPWWGRCAKPMAPISRQASAATCGSIPCAAARVPLSRKSSKESNRLATRHGVRLRQSYSRVAKRAATMASRYAHAKQFRRHQRQLRILRSRRSPSRLAAPRRSARNSSASAAGSFIPSMPRRWNASAKARPPRLASAGD
jgi:hypothetical protein